MRRFQLSFLLLWLVAPVLAQAEPAGEECTVGVACGRATADGRPLLWKNRDARERDNVVLALADGRIPYFGLCNAGNSDAVWGGANVAGFCIVNAVSRDLPEGSDQGPANGAFIKLALQQCETVAQFEELLRATDTSGRRTRANFGVIDAQGAAAFFEAGHACFRRFDAEGAASGVLLRTNFSVTGGGDRGRERLARAEELCAAPAARRLTPRFLLQQLLRDVKAPPSASAGGKGRLDVRETIHRQNTVAALVLHGVKAGEDAKWTTMWAVLGQPLFAMAVPLWPAAGVVPRSLSGDPKSSLCDLSQRLADAFYAVDAGAAGADDQGSEGDIAGAVRWLRSDTMPLARRGVLFGEAEILARYEDVLANWRQGAGAPPPTVQRAFQEAMAKLAAQRLQDLVDEFAAASTVK